MGDFFVGGIINPAFQNPYIHTTGVWLLKICNRCRTEISEFSNGSDSFIHIQQGHVAARATSHPIC
jgi:hypothetical protein